MVVVGGITRLTESGLSITEWKPVTGADPAAQPGGLAARVRAVQADPRISRGHRPGGNDPGRLQANLLVGVHPPAARAGDRPGLRRAVAVVRGAARDSARLRLEDGRPARARRAAGRARLVHGQLGPRRPHRRQPLPPRRAFAAGAGHHGRADLVRARPSPAGGGRGPAGPAHRRCRRGAGGAVRPVALRRLGRRPRRRQGREQLAADERPLLPRRGRLVEGRRGASPTTRS